MIPKPAPISWWLSRFQYATVTFACKSLYVQVDFCSSSVLKCSLKGFVSVQGNDQWGRINADMSEDVSHVFCQRDWLWHFQSAIRSGSQQILADLRQTPPVDTLVTQWENLPFTTYLFLRFPLTVKAWRLRGGDAAAGETIVLHWEVKPPMTGEPTHQSVNVPSFLPLIKIKCFFFFFFPQTKL